MDKLHEESRVQFEAWRKKFIGVMVNLDRDHKTGHYVCIGTWTAWEAWQAARAGIVVELPELSGNPMHFIGDCRTSKAAAFRRKKARDAVINECADALRSIGLSIKGE
jgi:hypothetical protein